MTGAQLAKIFPNFYEAQRSIKVLTTAQQLVPNTIQAINQKWHFPKKRDIY
jgi:hypothetical protein